MQSHNHVPNVEAIATDHVIIGVWTKPLETPKVSPLRARELHGQPPAIITAAAVANHLRWTSVRSVL
ncbi:hypothetical protein F2Q68_00017458 [Brassica cretica]|uniref:Uncharacterized protein n=1 Tax=Brassica cretica TaxID=69181 RepID=A0A8S9HFF1_BRACR|nr:hypothetical protein F2Q68_00017458 [Brassica cretica]